MHAMALLHTALCLKVAYPCHPGGNGECNFGWCATAVHQFRVSDTTSARAHAVDTREGLTLLMMLEP